MTCLCGRERPKEVGEPVELGDVVGFGQEESMRYGRVTGFIKAHVRLENLGAARVIVRHFRPGDGRWPSGSYSRNWLLVPWGHEHPTSEVHPSQEPVDWTMFR